jgi:hypothetical protein
MDQEVLAKISGAHHYEERLLFMLMLLQWPRTRLVYVTSRPIDPIIIDYYLHLLPGIPKSHALSRLLLLSCHDASEIPLTQKILDRPRLMRRLKEAIPDPRSAHITCFNASTLERTLSVRLNIPLYAPDPALEALGSKSGSRTIFQEAGVPMPSGFENLRSRKDIARSLAELKMKHPGLKKAVVKLNYGFSGEGNAVYRYEKGMDQAGSADWIDSSLPHKLEFEAGGETWTRFEQKFSAMGGIVETFIEGQTKRSPSVQYRINPLGEITAISTHDQVLGGPTGQVFLGCTFPADEAYRIQIQDYGLRIARRLAEYGVVGRFGVDFISVQEGNHWYHYAIEINLRKGGTTHPFLMLKFLTDGNYDPVTGLYRTPSGQSRFYYASDNLEQDHYRGLTPEDLIDISVYHNLHFHSATQEGVVFHLIGALSEFGKLGVVCIGDSPQKARQYYHDTVEILNREARKNG